MKHSIEGFSKLSKAEKVDWITKNHFTHPEEAKTLLASYWNKNVELQKRHDEFIENTLTNFYLPLGVAPNFIINGKGYTLPLVIEESSVVAAAGNAAKFWSQRGGFTAKVLSTEKVGQIHFFYKGSAASLSAFVSTHTAQWLESVREITGKMESRGGGIQSLTLVDKTADLPHYFQLHLTFTTVDAMGANFINSCLEHIAKSVETSVTNEPAILQAGGIEIVLCILSNYVPDCLVHAQVSCSVEDLGKQDQMEAIAFAEKMVQAVAIAKVEPYRAVTHNKGIMNGVDAILIATGNDFRAIEAGVHAFASRSGHYTSLSEATINNGQFTMELTLPLAVGTVGGLTSLHPMVKWSLELLGNPNAEELMKIIAVAGLAQNFAALRSLVTSGIQKGHMKMHLLNILNQFGASEQQKESALHYFKTNTVSVQAVRLFLENYSA